MKDLLFLVSVLGTIFKTEAIDLCIFLNNCPPGSPFHNTNGGNAQGKDDNIPLVIEVRSLIFSTFSTCFSIPNIFFLNLNCNCSKGLGQLEMSYQSKQR